jgi:hypothetical protein
MWKNKLLASLCLTALFTGIQSAQAEGLPKRFEFGRIPLDGAVEKVPPWAVKSNCDAPIGLSGCTFSDPDGISYDVINSAVCTKTFHVDAKTKHRLPYGIRFESSKSEIVAYLSKKLKLKFTQKDSRKFESGPLAPKVFDGSMLSLRFDRNDKLASIELWELCV